MLRAHRERNQIYRFERTPFLHRHHHQYRTYRSLFRSPSALPSSRHPSTLDLCQTTSCIPKASRPLSRALCSPRTVSPLDLSGSIRGTPPLGRSLRRRRTRSRLPRRWRRPMPCPSHRPSSHSARSYMLLLLLSSSSSLFFVDHTLGGGGGGSVVGRAVAPRRFFSIGQRW